jgi:hypothetical protein
MSAAAGQPPRDAAQELAGTYVGVWEKDGKDWRLTTDRWNEGK